MDAEEIAGDSRCYCSDLDCIDEDDKEITYCYVEGTQTDKTGKETIKEIQEEVWCKVKPPKRSWPLCKPFVSARQIEITRTLLMGKNIPSLEDDLLKVPPSLEKVRIPLERRKSSVRFLNKGTFNPGACPL